VIRFTQDIVEGIGHLFIKSVQCLVNAGIHHMIREGAYYRFRFVRRGADGLALEDWLTAEKDMLRDDFKKPSSTSTSWMHLRRQVDVRLRAAPSPNKHPARNWCVRSIGRHHMLRFC